MIVGANRQAIAVRLCVICLFVAGSLAIAYGAARLIATFQQGADPASALNLVPNVPLDWPVDLTWRPDAADSGREMEPFTREQIESNYIRAWLQLSFSYSKGEPFGLKTYFVGPALEMATDSVLQVTDAGFSAEQVATSHELELHFYSADGSIVAFTDHRAHLVQLVRDADGRVLNVRQLPASYDVVMFLEDGNWRVRHWLRTAALEPVSAERWSDELPAEQFAGINYYPQATPWLDFWPNYDPTTVAADLDRIVDLGLNSLRIFIPYTQFGEDEVDPQLLQNVGHFLDAAHAHRLQVIVTLFDFKGDYSVYTWPATAAHIDGVVSEVGSHPAILAWDIKNEPDLDYDTQPQPLVDAWLAFAAARLRASGVTQPLTIGWSSSAAATRLVDEVDLVSYHFYGDLADFDDAYALVEAAAAEKPILLTEFGLPSWNSPFFPNGHSQAEQADYTHTLLSQWRATAGRGYFIWTLHDFGRMPTYVAGRAPWQRGPQRHMGLFDRNGDAKPVANYVAPDAASVAPELTRWQPLLQPFWLFWMTNGLLMMAGFLALRWRLRRSKT